MNRRSKGGIVRESRHILLVDCTKEKRAGGGGGEAREERDEEKRGKRKFVAFSSSPRLRVPPHPVFMCMHVPSLCLSVVPGCSAPCLPPGHHLCNRSQSIPFTCHHTIPFHGPRVAPLRDRVLLLLVAAACSAWRCCFAVSSSQNLYEGYADNEQSICLGCARCVSAEDKNRPSRAEESTSDDVADGSLLSNATRSGVYASMHTCFSCFLSSPFFFFS